MKIKIKSPWCFTEQGRKDNQEDYLWPMPENEGTAGLVFSGSSDGRVFLMCDGVGGRDSGEVASMTAANAIGKYITGNFDLDKVFTKEDFEKALSAGYDELDKVGNDSLNRMATTMTCIVLHRGGVLVAHIGDSRVYQVRPSQVDGKERAGIKFQTADHSLVNDLLRVGELTEEEAVNFPQKNVITRAMQPHLERRYKADIENITDIKPGDYFFLCSDGVLEQLTNDKLSEILSDKTLDDKGKIEAIKAICDGKTRDNYTCWLVPIEEAEMEAADALVVDDDVVADVVESVEDESEQIPAKPSGTAKGKSSKKRFTPAPETTTPLPGSSMEDAARTRRSRIANAKIMFGLLALVAVACLGGYLFASGWFSKKPVAEVKAEKENISDIKEPKNGDAKAEKKDDDKQQPTHQGNSPEIRTVVVTEHVHADDPKVPEKENPTTVPSASRDESEMEQIKKEPPTSPNSSSSSSPEKTKQDKINGSQENVNGTAGQKQVRINNQPE